MDEIYKNIEEYNPNEKRKILIVFDDMIADMLSNKNLNPAVTELFIIRRKLTISLVCQKYQTKFYALFYIDFKNFMNFYKKCTAKPYSFYLLMLLLTIDDDIRDEK